MRNRSLPVSGRTVEKHGPARVHRRPSLLDHGVFERKFAERFANPLEGDQFIGQLLQVHAKVEFLDVDRRRSGITQLIQGIEGEALDRKSTRLELQSLRHLVCRLLLEKKKEISTKR